MDKKIKEKIDNFLMKSSTLPKIIVIYWPTACWKTNLSLDIAEYLGTEIIWADSRQIYRGLDIWTWKIKEKEKRWIKHHMIDIKDIKEEYSVWEYKKDSKKIINEIHSKNLIPIICGWTGLYIDAISYNFDIPEIEPDWVLRNELEILRIEKWNEYIWNMLHELDPDYANDIEKNNYRYVIRWIEVFKKSKKALKKKLPETYDKLFITPYEWDREDLYSKINLRIDEMFQDGLIDEVKSLINQGYEKNDYWMVSIWYREPISYIEWEINLEECKNLVKQHNRNYAKRQLTWFKKYEK